MGIPCTDVRLSACSLPRLTVLCSFSNGDASVSVRVDNPPPLAASTNQGPLSLILLSYPGKPSPGSDEREGV